MACAEMQVWNQVGMINNWFENSSRFSNCRLFFDDSGNDVTYQAMLNFSAVLTDCEVSRKLVFCIVDNRIDGLLGYLALMTADAVPMMVSATLSSEVVRSLGRSYRPDFVWLPIARVDEWPSAQIRVSYESYCLIELPRIDPPVFLHPDLGLLLSTSGSTGSSKYVRLSKRNIWANASAISEYLLLTSKEVAITTMPPNYSYGLSIIHSHVLVGASLAVTGKTFFDREFWDFFREAQATSMGGVPYHYEMLKKLRFAKMQLPSLKTLTQAGGRMDPDLTREYAIMCDQKNIRFFTMYGQTEATARMSFVPAEQAKCKAGTVGIAVPGGAFELHDEQGNIVDVAGVAGELVYRGPNVCMGYAQDSADLPLDDENQGVLRTGDLAQRDSDGFYTIIGRKRRFIKLFGNRINLQDVEDQLSAQGLDAACAGSDDTLEIYLTDITLEKALDAKKTVSDRLQVNAQAVKIYSLDALPRSDAGKILYIQLHPEKARLLA